MLIHEYFEMDVYGLTLIINSVCPYIEIFFVVYFVIYFHHYLRLSNVETLTWIVFFVAFIHSLIRIKQMPTHNTHNLRSSPMGF